MKGIGVAALVLAVLLVAALSLRLRRFHHEGSFRASQERNGFSVRIPLQPGQRPPPCFPGGVSCGLDGRCTPFAWIALPTDVDVVGSAATLDHVEFSLPGLERWGVTAQTLTLDGRVVRNDAAWPVYGAYALLCAFPVLAWAGVAGARALVAPAPPD